MAKEKQLVQRVRKLIDRRFPGSHFIKTSGEGEPDLVGVIMGRSVVIECKQDKKRPEILQLARLRQWSHGGSIAIWVDETVVHVVRPDGSEYVACPLADMAQWIWENR
jgi:hypothetical protein